MNHDLKTDLLFVPEGFHTQYRQFRHGGMRREAQVAGLIRRSCNTVLVCNDQTLPDHAHGSAFMSVGLTEGIRYERHLTGQWPITRARLKNAQRWGRQIRSYHDFLDQHPNVKLIVTENLRSHGRLVTVARSRSVRVVCAPHDMSALSDGACYHSASIHALRVLHLEVATLGQANAVFGISREQQWLLKGFGIPCQFLPYYPVESDLAPLLHIRDRRSSGVGDTIVIIGTASHSPTRLGIVELIGWLGEVTERSGFGRVVVAGYGTEALASEGRSAGVEVLGALSESELVSLLSEAKAVLVHQQFGCGALTRITELLLAGVPVVASPIAARSHHGSEGVYVFDSVAEMGAILNGPLQFPPPPARPIGAEERFVETLRYLANGSSL